MIARRLSEIIKNKDGSNKAIVLLGARQTGKSTLLRHLFPPSDEVMWFLGDEMDVQAVFAEANANRLRLLFGSHKVVVIDEAQRIPNIGLKLKLITDQIPEVRLVVTGSSAFELANRLNEPLTGRKWEYQLYPLSFGEMVSHHGLLVEKRLLPHRLIYGYYPDVVCAEGNAREVLRQLADSYLYKDILLFDRIKHSDKLVALLQALAYQVGSQVSYRELATTVGIDAKTVETYIQLLEQSYIIFRLSSFSRNLRNELKQSRKIFFYDNGVRNALVSNFAPAEIRADMGALWENFVIAERVKYLEYNRLWANRYFWRTHDQKEIDYLEDSDGIIKAYEFKYNAKKKAKLPTAFSNAYPDAIFKEITPDNIEDFLL